MLNGSFASIIEVSVKNSGNYIKGMDDNNNRYSRTRRRRRSRRRLSNLRPVLPNLLPPILQNPSRLLPLNPLPFIPNFRALGENWCARPESWSPLPENWPPTSEYWRPSPSGYWQPPYESWPPVTDSPKHAVGNWSPLAEDRRSLLLSNDGQSLLTVLNRRNKIGENTAPNSETEVQTKDASDPDVVYLYSVDISTEGHFAEEVDLTGDSVISSTLPQPSPSQPVSVESQPGKGSKRKLSDSRVETKKRQRNLGQPCCSFCLAHYDELRERNQFLCVARCGHTFCRPCTSSKGTRKVCNICKTSIGSLYKIFL